MILKKTTTLFSSKFCSWGVSSTYFSVYSAIHIEIFLPYQKFWTFHNMVFQKILEFLFLNISIQTISHSSNFNSKLISMKNLARFNNTLTVQNASDLLKKDAPIVIQIEISSLFECGRSRSRQDPRDLIILRQNLFASYYNRKQLQGKITLIISVGNKLPSRQSFFPHKVQVSSAKKCCRCPSCFHYVRRLNFSQRIINTDNR